MGLVWFQSSCLSIPPHKENAVWGESLFHFHQFYKFPPGNCTVQPHFCTAGHTAARVFFSLSFFPSLFSIGTESAQLLIRNSSLHISPWLTHRSDFVLAQRTFNTQKPLTSFFGDFHLNMDHNKMSWLFSNSISGGSVSEECAATQEVVLPAKATLI